MVIDAVPAGMTWRELAIDAAEDPVDRAFEQIPDFARSDAGSLEVAPLAIHEDDRPRGPQEEPGQRRDKEPRVRPKMMLLVKPPS